MDKISGILEEIIYANEQNGYKVCVFSVEDTYVTTKGIMPLASPGEYFELRGNWEDHPEYGPQFSVKDYEKKMPESLEDIESFLSSGLIEGVGAVTAHLIVEKFGKKTFKTISETPSLLESIRGITHEKAMRIHNTLEEHKDMSELVSFLSRFKIGSGLSVRVFQHFGKNAVAEISRNPYILCKEIPGITFEKSEEVAQSLGFPSDAQERICAGIMNMLSRAAGEGHVFLPRKVLESRCIDELHCRAEDVEEAIQTLHHETSVFIKYTPEEERVYTWSYYKKEKYIAERLITLSEKKHRVQKKHFDEAMRIFSEQSGIVPDETQKNAVLSSGKNGVSIITGGPGTGKTTIIRCIIKYLALTGVKCVLAAPTGRAAKRMTEACMTEAKTIHRLLEVNADVDSIEDRSDERIFRRNEINPLDCEAIIVDECSMIDMVLFYHLLKALKHGTRLILVGDVDQLPPVGPGAVLCDCINSKKFNTVILNEIYRQETESLIPANAMRINGGELPKVNIAGGDFFFLREKTKDGIAGTVTDLIKNRLKTKYNIENLNDIQVIISTKRGPCGVIEMNNILQNALNSDVGKHEVIQCHGTELRVGDRVMQTRNNYDIEWTRPGRYEEIGKGIFNGEMGEVSHVDAKGKIVQILFDDDRVAEYDMQMLQDIELSYAITVHKSQGSEFDYCIIPVFDTMSNLMSRNLLYTAVTRAKKMVILVGMEHSLCTMVKNNHQLQRYTGLEEMLCSED